MVSDCIEVVWNTGECDKSQAERASSVCDVGVHEMFFNVSNVP